MLVLVAWLLCPDNAAIPCINAEIIHLHVGRETMAAPIGLLSNTANVLEMLISNISNVRLMLEMLQITNIKTVSISKAKKNKNVDLMLNIKLIVFEIMQQEDKITHDQK